MHSACPHWTQPHSIRPDLSESKKTKQSFRPPPMQASDGGLGDYTQWVHLACPHWTYYHSTRSDLSEYKQKKQTCKHCLYQTPADASTRWRSRGLHPVGALSMPPLDILSLDQVRPVEWKATSKTNLRPLPMSSSFDSGLGDYTQWVHLACPHWTRTYSTKT